MYGQKVLRVHGVQVPLGRESFMPTLQAAIIADVVYVQAVATCTPKVVRVAL